MAPAAVVEAMAPVERVQTGVEAELVLGAGKPSDKVPVVDVTASGLAEDKAVDRFEPHPSQAPAAPTREMFAAEGPVIATGDPRLAGVQKINGCEDNAAHIPLNTQYVTLDTNLFSGKMLISVRGTPTTAAAAAPGGPLACKHRTFHIAIQGRFKRSFRAADLVSGQEFPKPPRSASLMHFVFSGAARVFASTIDVFVHDGKPMHYKFPALAAAQLVNISPVGQEPDPLAASEDVTVWAPELADKRTGAPLPPEKRRRFFDHAANLASRSITTEHVWTMHFHQSLVDFSTYKLGLPGVPVHIDLTSILDAMPLQIMAKDAGSGDYAFNVLMWNERLLYSHQPHHGHGHGHHGRGAARNSGSGSARNSGSGTGGARGSGTGAASDGGAAAAEAVQGLKNRFKGLLSGW